MMKIQKIYIKECKNWIDYNIENSKQMIYKGCLILSHEVEYVNKKSRKHFLNICKIL
ncbi:unnamed protein product [Paramecium pentaurelia]|uniref:Uncharacterized protein n=1 Tax=Paramecium pentaurelia TaxID=43138 RepID=A0A8S1URX7_9CILI|nr:unnamed protein product [Paramecium pentaurelia]